MTLMQVIYRSYSEKVDPVAGDSKMNKTWSPDLENLLPSGKYGQLN
jgi:hypothetical protein